MISFLRGNNLAALAILIFAVPMIAQAPGTGAIKGTVYDPSGLPIAHAHLLVVNESTQASRAVDTAAGGYFAVPLLAPGSYSVTVQQTGFESEEEHKVVVGAGETTTLDVRLSIARQNDTVEVNAVTELAQTQSATLGRSVDNQAIQALPLANRNFTQLLSLSPGVVVALPDATALGRGTQNVTANGNKTTANNIQFNGIDANNLSQNSARSDGEEVGVAVPAPDTIQEFKVQTANYDAGYGRGTGANVDLISKSGTNQFHGSVWEFVRNDIFNANTFFLERSEPAAPGPEAEPVWRFPGRPDLQEQDFLLWGISRTSLQQWPGQREYRLFAATDAQIDPLKLSGRNFAAQGRQTPAGRNWRAMDRTSIPSRYDCSTSNFQMDNSRYLLRRCCSPVSPGQTPIGESTFSIPATYQEDQYTANIDQTLSATKTWLSARFFYSRAPTVTAVLGQRGDGARLGHQRTRPEHDVRPRIHPCLWPQRGQPRTVRLHALRWNLVYRESNLNSGSRNGISAGRIWGGHSYTWDWCRRTIHRGGWRDTLSKPGHEQFCLAGCGVDYPGPLFSARWP